MSAIKVQQTRIEVTIIEIKVDICEESGRYTDQDIIGIARCQMTDEQIAKLDEILGDADLIKCEVSPYIVNEVATVTMRFEREIETPSLTEDEG